MKKFNKNTTEEFEKKNAEKTPRSFIVRDVFLEKTSTLFAKIPLPAWVIFGLALSALVFWDYFKSGGICYAKRFFDIACPSCGMTRAALSLLRLDLASAFYYHPFFWDVPLIIGFCALTMTAKTQKTKRIFLFITLILFIAYILCWIVRLFTNTTV